MTQALNTEEIINLTRNVAALYCQEGPEQTLGEWVLSKFYPDRNEFNLLNARDFLGAVRTFDGRMYLSGMLRSGSLNPEPLICAIESAEISERTLSMII